MDLKETPATNLIEIGVYDTDAQRAANIANMLAVVYQQKRREELQKSIDRGLEQLKAQVEKQQKAVEETAGEAMKIRARDGIIDADPDNENSQVGARDGNVAFDQQQLLEQQVRVVELVYCFVIGVTFSQT
jgi:hypothetical protein